MEEKYEKTRKRRESIRIVKKEFTYRTATHRVCSLSIRVNNLFNKYFIRVQSLQRNQSLLQTIAAQSSGKQLSRNASRTKRSIFNLLLPLGGILIASRSTCRINYRPEKRNNGNANWLERPEQEEATIVIARRLLANFLDFRRSCRIPSRSMMINALITAMFSNYSPVKPVITALRAFKPPVPRILAPAKLRSGAGWCVSPLEGEKKKDVSARRWPRYC